MSKLDDKLREVILYGVCDQGVHEVEGIDPESVDEVIPQIKQAFADEGYLPTINYKGLNETEKAELTRRLFDQKYMTGQEWYDRFEKELNEGFKAGTLSVLELNKHLNEIAKKASGISDD